MHWPPILSLCGIPMGVLSNPSSARLRPYLILFVLREITRHVVLSRSWHRMGEMQIKLSLHLINTRKHHAGENQQLLFISLWVQLSHHLVSGCQRKTEEQEKTISEMLLDLFMHHFPTATTTTPRGTKSPVIYSGHHSFCFPRTGIISVT